MSNLYQQLTEPQRAAVDHVDGPLLVLAGPGSGKTHVVTSRIARLIERGVRDDSILALTFTNKAADEMKHRVRQMAPYANVWISTFHRFCSQLLRKLAPYVGLQENFTIYDASDSLELLKDVIDDSRYPLTHHSPSQIAQAISNAKNRLLTPEQFNDSATSVLHEKAAHYYAPFQQRLREANAVDFDDLLMHVALLLINNEQIRHDLDTQYRYVMVDEYQDTNYAQYCIARGLSVDYPNLAVTGDPDQSIYGWRGADVQNILSFERDYPTAKLVRLEQNYRSTPEILRVANQLISNNIHRKEKESFTSRPSGERVALIRFEDERDEAGRITDEIAQLIESGERQPRDFAILYRINALSRTFEHALREHGLPYQIVNGVEFYQRKEVKDVLAYLRLVNNPSDRIAFLRVVNVPPRGLGKKSIQVLNAYADAHRLTLLDAARQAKSIPGLTKKAVAALVQFGEIFAELARQSDTTVETCIVLATQLSGYIDHLRDSPSEEDRNRLANIQELETAARQYDEVMGDDGSLEGFLEQASLVNDVDAWDDSDNKVTLMTLHAAKGLEFPFVYIIALENEIFPHPRAIESSTDREEERRLFFVGITRAKDRLQLSFVERRNFRGRAAYAVPSSFLMELPRDECETTLSNSYAMHHRSGRRGTEQQQFDDDLHPVWDDDYSQVPPDEADVTLDAADDGYSQVDVIDDFDESSAPTRLARSAYPSTTSGTPRQRRDQISRPGYGSASSSADDIDIGTSLEHAQLGRGQVIAINGTGKGRRATVAFMNPPSVRTFVIAMAPLKIVQ